MGCVEAYSSARNTAARMVESLQILEKTNTENEFMMIDADGNEVGLGARCVFEKAAAGDLSAIAVLEEVLAILFQYYSIANVYIFSFLLMK